MILTALLALALAAPAFAQHDHGHGHGEKAAPAKKDDGAAKAPKAFDEPPPVGTKATCPVMGGEFVVEEETKRSEYEGKHYVFCCPMCKPKFDKDPEKYVGAGGEKPAGHGEHGHGEHGHGHGGHPAP